MKNAGELPLTLSEKNNASAVRTLVERTSRLVMLVKLPDFKPASAANVMQAFTEKLMSIAAPMRQSMTYDQGREMALHKELSKRTGIAVYFCDPHCPWQRGSNENMNGLVRQYLPKGTDLSVYSQEQLDAIADEINGRPRKGLGVRSPLVVYRELLLNATQHSPSSSESGVILQGSWVKQVTKPVARGVRASR